MTIQLNYLLQANLIIALLYLLYHLLLKNEPSYRLNRFFLLACIPSSFILPLLPGLLPANDILFQGRLSEVVINSREYTTGMINTWSTGSLIFIAYICGAFAAAGFFLLRLTRLIKLISGAETLRSNGDLLYLVPGKYSPASFFNYILWNKNDDPENASGRLIIDHEKIHISHGHSLDNLLINIIQIICWFNPVVYLYSKAIKEQHEFIADRLMKRKSAGDTYKEQIIRKVIEQSGLELIHHFSQIPIKRRLIMYSKDKISRFFNIKLSLLAFMLTGVTYFFSCGNIEDDTPLVPEPEKMAQFPGGNNALITYLQENITYPADMKKEGIEGVVVISYEIDKEGNIQNPEVLKSVHGQLDKAALKVVEDMPAWEPAESEGKKVRTEFKLPVRFTLKE